MKRLVIGILAHVDSGKTTLSEAMLYNSGEIRKLGRVDHKNAFLDTHHIEQDRGITIFSKQAVMHIKNAEITLLDTPGHVDFSGETERVLQVLDYAILVISGSEGVQAHTETLWNLLKQYKIPTFIFINKIDIASRNIEDLTNELKKKLTDSCIDFSMTNSEEFFENISLCDDELMNEFLKFGEIEPENIKKAIKNGIVFPCYFGSALKLDGVNEFLNSLEKYIYESKKSVEFGAKVFKIAEDDKGTRLTYLKVTGGCLKVKDSVNYGNNFESEKINQIRIYSGAKYQTTDVAECGVVCAVTGLSHTFAGMGLGVQSNSCEQLTEPVLSYRIDFEGEPDMTLALKRFKQLEEEEPLFHVEWNQRLKEMHIKVMGEIQLEVLKQLVMERFNMNVSFSHGSISYKETIKNTVEGVGHYEPLRHYAEVHLLLEPTKRGSGITICTKCDEDKLSRNWQRLVLTHLHEKNFLGVLTGSPITDIKITLIAGKAHLKHTEGGDFRQATYRAVRQGLRSAESVLLEPWYSFKIEVPSENVGRTMNDINNMGGEFSQPEINGESSIIIGSAPVEKMRDYHKEIIAYTAGKGKIVCTFKGYEPCLNSQMIIDDISYNVDEDIENTADSVFCSHGAGFVVKWDKVTDYMHLDGINKKVSNEIIVPRVRDYIANISTNDDLMKIFEMTYGPIRQKIHESRIVKVPNKISSSKKSTKIIDKLEGAEYLLVDGYNIIFAWDELKMLASKNLDLARNSLINILCDYQGVMQCELILVFDAYKVKNNKGSTEKIHNINVVYTKEAETADMYIEKVTHELRKKRRVRVATSDGLEQLIILGNGAMRISAEGFRLEVNEVRQTIKDFIKNQGAVKKAPKSTAELQ